MHITQSARAAFLLLSSLEQSAQTLCEEALRLKLATLLCACGTFNDIHLKHDVVYYTRLIFISFSCSVCNWLYILLPFVLSLLVSPEIYGSRNVSSDISHSALAWANTPFVAEGRRGRRRWRRWDGNEKLFTRTIFLSLGLKYNFMYANFVFSIFIVGERVNKNCLD